MSSLSTHAQRLQWQWEERTDGYELEPSLAEQLELADAEFRHFDQYTFARAADKPLGDPARDGAATSSSGSSGSGPELAQPSLPAGGAAVLPPGDRSAVPFEHHMWAA